MDTLDCEDSLSVHAVRETVCMSELVHNTECCTFLNLQLREVQDEREELREAEGKEQQHAEDEIKRVDQLLSKRAHLIQKQADLGEKIRDLGTIPAASDETYSKKHINVGFILAKLFLSLWQLSLFVML